MLPFLSRADVRGQRVLLRVDFNVPISGGRVRDDFRLKAALPTIKHLLAKGNRIVVMSHHSDYKQSLRPLVKCLESILGTRVVFGGRILPPAGGDWRSASAARIVMLENLRFWPGEQREDRAFVKRLAGLGDVFVNDAFGASHRRAASISGLPRLLPSYLGLLFEKELGQLSRVVNHPRRPLVAVFGGAKVETKLPLLKRFVRRADKVVVGGAIANVLLKVLGREVGESPVSGAARKEVMKIARAKNLILPVDVVVASSARSRRGRLVAVEAVGKGEVILDIGPRTAALINREVDRARTVVWNGPLGLVEVKAFSAGTLAVAKALARRQESVLLGGGDSVAFLHKAGLLERFKHVSTGGGAMLAYLAGEKLPALEALKRSKN